MDHHTEYSMLEDEYCISLVCVYIYIYIFFYVRTISSVLQKNSMPFKA